MSKLDILIKELCPDGVEYVKLGKVAEIGTGKSNRQDESAEGKYPFYVRSKNILKSDTFQFDETAIILPGEGGIGDIFHFVRGKYALHQRAYRIHIKSEVLDTKFLYYYMGVSFKQYILAKSVGATSISIRKPMLEGFKIPLPPFPVQKEIVRILDNFTELTTALTTSLTAELTARKKQYEYYRDELFGKSLDEMARESQHGNIKLVPLHELGEFTRGKRFIRKDIREVGVPCIHYGDLYTYYGTSADKTKWFLDKELATNMRFAEKNDIVIVQAGENDEEIGIGVAWLGDEKVAIHDACYIFRHSINPKYISHYLRTSIYNLQIRKYVSRGKICSISAKNIGRALVPVPSLEEQERIVSILDKFDALVNDISISLPAEIEARQKQYEYYREKLLTFKNSEPKGA